MKFPHFAAALQKAIKAEVEEFCESDDWPEFICPPDIEEHMTDAAMAVFHASVEASQYAEKEKS